MELLRGYLEHRLAGLESLPDDLQIPAQVKPGPFGQVIRPSNAAITAASRGRGGQCYDAVTVGTTVAGWSFLSMPQLVL